LNSEIIPAAFAGLNERDVKYRRPVAQPSQGIGYRRALGNGRQHCADAREVRGVGWIALEHVEHVDDGDAGGGQLADLLVELRATGELPG
jgi:hypothetical protein